VLKKYQLGKVKRSTGDFLPFQIVEMTEQQAKDWAARQNGAPSEDGPDWEWVARPISH
jgi:hypothetical protein